MYAGNQIGLIKKVVHALSFTRLVPERSETEPERFISSLLWNSIFKLLRNFWFSYKLWSAIWPMSWWCKCIRGLGSGRGRKWSNDKNVWSFESVIDQSLIATEFFDFCLIRTENVFLIRGLNWMPSLKSFYSTYHYWIWPRLTQSDQWQIVMSMSFRRLLPQNNHSRTFFILHFQISSFRFNQF